mgnify:CR=1 FL=1
MNKYLKKVKKRQQLQLQKLQPFDLSSEANKGKITDIQFTYKKDGVVVKPNQSVDVSKHDDLSMTYKLWFEGIPATTLKQCGGIMSYKLPEGFTIKKSYIG